MSSYEFFFSFEWLCGLLVAQVLRAALSAASRAPPRGWFALEQDAASPAETETGVRASAAFVVVLTDGYFTHNVRHEVACAVAAGKRVVVLHDAACGRGVEALLDQAAALVDPAVIAGKGLRHLDAAGAAEFKARALAGPAIPFYRDARLVTDAAPALAAALAAGVVAPPPPALQKPFKVRALRPAVGDCDALFVAAGDAALQALYLAEAAKGACGARSLVADVLPPGGGADAAEAAVARAGAVVLVLSSDAWNDAAFVGAARAALGAKKRLALVHEADVNFQGEPVFNRIYDVTPGELKAVYNKGGVAVVLERGRGREALLLEGLLPELGCLKVSETPRLPPPPLPPGYYDAATAAPRAGALAALLADARPSAVAVVGLGGAGKTTIAASIALDPQVVAAFDDVVWVTVGKVDHAGMVGILGELLDALESGEEALTAGEKKALDPVSFMVQRLRAVCARRAVLLVADDVWAPTGWAPDAATLLLSAVDVPSMDGGGASMALFTARDADDRIFSRLAERAQRGLARVAMGPLKEPVAAAYLADAAHVGGAGAGAVAPILASFGTLPLALTLAAACLRAEVERDASVPLEEAVAAVAALQDGAPLGEGGGAPKPGTWLDSGLFCAALERANEHWWESDYTAIYRALQAALKGAVLPKHYPNFATFGLLEDGVYAPEGVLAATWGLSDEDTRALLKLLQKAGLIKWEAQARRVVLHDLAHDFAAAMAATQRGGAAAAHGALVDRCGAALVEGGGAWWRAKPGVESGTVEYVGGGQLLRHLREAGRGAEATEVVWKLQWLIHAVQVRGGAALTNEVGAQLAWERTQGEPRREEATAMKLLHQALVMGAGAWEGAEGPGNVAPQVLGRLGGLEGGAGGARVAALVGEAAGWDGGGRAWLRPVRPNFPPPGGACEAVLDGHTEGVTSVTALGDGRLASASSDKMVRVWDASSGICLRVLEGHTGCVNSVTALGDGRLASASDDKTVLVWDASSGFCLRVLEGHTRHVNSVTAVGDGRLASASSDKTVRLWNASSGVCLRVLEGHTKRVNSVTALSDGRLATASSDMTVRVWGASSGVCLRVLEGHTEWVNSVTALGDGRLASASCDKTVRLWDASSGVCLRVLERHTSGVNSVTALGDGRLASASGDKTVRLWNASSGVCLRVLEGHTKKVNSVAALGNGRLASVSLDNTVRVWDVSSGFSLRVPEGHRGWVNSVTSLGDGRLASASSDKTVRVWDASSGVCLRVLEGHTDRVHSGTALGDGRLASASDDKTVRVWDASSGVCLRVLEGHTGEVRSVTTLGNGRLASASGDKTVRVWDASSGVCLRVLEGHRNSVTSVTALGDGRLASASSDMTVRVWDASSGVCLRVLERHTSGVNSVTALGNGRLASVSADNTVRVWNASSGVCLETVPHFSRRAAKLLASALPGSDVPAFSRCGRTRAHFSPWGASPVYLGADVNADILLNLPDGRCVAATGLVNGQVHLFELVQAPVPGVGGN
jgi:WD40 repeat protein